MSKPRTECALCNESLPINHPIGICWDCCNKQKMKGKKPNSKHSVRFEQLINGQWIYRGSNLSLTDGFPIRISAFKNFDEYKNKIQIPNLPKT